MDKLEIESLRRSVKLEYANLMKQLETELQEKLAAIDLVAGIIDRGAILEVKRIRLPPESDKPTTNVSEEVRKAIDSLEGVFSIREIRDVVAEVDPDITISRNVSHSVLSEYVKSGKLQVVEMGKGRMPTTYRKTETKKEENHE